MATFFTQINSKRRVWSAMSPSVPEHGKSFATDTLSRALSLRVLEIPVGDFITDGLSRNETKNLGQEAIDTLQRNVEDEIRHDTALNNCVSVYAEYNDSYEDEAASIAKQWMQSPEHPILKACVLENGIFFVILPLMRQFGGDALRLTSQDISLDEVLHVQTNRYVSKQLGQRPTRALDNLRKDTVAWIVDKFNSPMPTITKDTFIKASDNLMYKGVSNELKFTQNYQTPAFFEKRNDVLSYYA